MTAGPTVLGTGAGESSPTGETAYNAPPQEISRLQDAARFIDYAVSGNRQRLAALEYETYIPLERLRRPVRLGPRFSERGEALWGERAVSRVTIVDIKTGKQVSQIDFDPEDVALGLGISSDGKHLVSSVLEGTERKLWLATTAGQRLKVDPGPLNSAWGAPCRFVTSKRLLCSLEVPTNSAEESATRAASRGANMQESRGARIPVRASPDVLRDAADDLVFQRHFRRQFALIDLPDGKITKVGQPGLIRRVSVARAAKHLLFERLAPPFPRLIPVNSFPSTVEVLDLKTKKVVARINLPGTTRSGAEERAERPRSFDWMPTEPATLTFITPVSDATAPGVVEELRAWSAPFDEAPRTLARVEGRIKRRRWLQDGGLIIEDVVDAQLRYHYQPQPEADLNELWIGSAEDPLEGVVKVLTRRGFLLEKDGLVLSTGRQLSPSGLQYRVLGHNPRTGEERVLFESPDDAYEVPLLYLDDDSTSLLVRRETPTSPPNYYVATGDTRRPLTHYTLTHPLLQQSSRRYLSYQREDGVELSGVLHLPPGFKPGQPVPTLVWVYPRDYLEQEAAERLADSVNRFPSFKSVSPLLLLEAGYAILENPTMPTLAREGQSPNDSYIEQLKMNADAAVSALVEAGVSERNNIAVGGHSYGAFTTANLLIHTDLFVAGIARSGAYNRTLTPFGFQQEERSFWDAPEVYTRMSPFFHADQLDEPLLMIHGELDENPGTWPLQSERFYQALVGSGAHVRYVTLPSEGHHYRARESQLHAAWEMLQWCERHLHKPE